MFSAYVCIISNKQLIIIYFIQNELRGLAIILSTNWGHKQQSEVASAKPGTGGCQHDLQTHVISTPFTPSGVTVRTITQLAAGYSKAGRCAITGFLYSSNT